MKETSTYPAIYRKELLNHFLPIMQRADIMNRQMVSFQVSKNEPVSRWFKYKEAFSANLVKQFIEEFGPKSGVALDPFAGIGTTLFAAQDLGWIGIGIELLPVGIFAMKTREAIRSINLDDLSKAYSDFWVLCDEMKEVPKSFNHIPITEHAFSPETEELIQKYVHYCSGLTDVPIRQILLFVAFSVLEDVSFTRKDGQYLRWDERSARKLRGKPFNKGNISSFNLALNTKFRQIINDLREPLPRTLFDGVEESPEVNPVRIIEGSCLYQLPLIESETIDFAITSPPYCNRYDYTRTYALELVFLGINISTIKDLRQSMLSCTVENREKILELSNYYTQIDRLESFNKIMGVYNSSLAMSEVNGILDLMKKDGILNNSGVPRMVKNYFLEMCFVIYEIGRITRSGGYFVMVNDNVQYGGEEIPVDLILSEFAQNLDFSVEKIFILPKGKGNSSQQMGIFGRNEIRKCIYLWKKR